MLAKFELVNLKCLLS